MNRDRSAATKRKSALIIRYGFDINVFSGLSEKHFSEVSSLLRIHADRSQLVRLSAEIDAILQDELELDRQVSNRVVLTEIDQRLPADRMIDGEAARSSGKARSPGNRRGPAGSLDKLADQLQSLLGRVSERRRPSSSNAGAE